MTHVTFIDGDGARWEGDDVPEWRDTLIDGLARHVSEEAAVYWDRDVANAPVAGFGSGLVVDEYLRVVRKLGTWRAFHNPPRSRFDHAGANPNAFVAEWDPGAEKWWTGLEQNSMKNAVEHVVIYIEGSPGLRAIESDPVPSMRDRLSKVLINRGFNSHIVPRRFLEECDWLGEWKRIDWMPDRLVDEARAVGRIIRHVLTSDYYDIDMSGVRRVTFISRTLNWVEGGLGETGLTWLKTQRAHQATLADEVEIRLHAYANLIVELPPFAFDNEPMQAVSTDRNAFDDARGDLADGLDGH